MNKRVRTIMRLGGLTTAVVAVLSMSGAATAAGGPEPTPPPTTRIVGGQPASETYSFMASLQSAPGSHTCGGNLVDPSWIGRHGPAGYAARSGRPRRTGTPGEYRTLTGSPEGAGRPAAATRFSSHRTSSARCSGQRGCSLGR